MDAAKHTQAWLALHLIPGLGPVTCNRLVAHFGSPEGVLAADISDLRAVCHLRRESMATLSNEGRRGLEALAKQEVDLAAAKKISLIPCDDPLYPAILKHIHDPPVVLYVRGKPESLNCIGIGMVGSRSATQYGRSVAVQMANSLAGQGFTIISGMALGIDTAAHRGALEAGARTIAVLGCGLDIVYPPSNAKLYGEIVASGAVISEYPLGTPPEGFRFPARNRIISGLSLGVVVVEAANRSGSLITARHALEQGREVFAVPGRIDSAKSAGTHALLQQGAKLVHSIHDIVEEFHPGPLAQVREEAGQGVKTGENDNLSGDEAALFAILDVYPLTIDEIARQSGYGPQKTSELLLLLELKGLVASLPGNYYRRSSVLTS
jgi:DNA processing protein